jgi:hypothetical protein
MKAVLLALFAAAMLAVTSSAADEVTYSGELLGGRMAVGGETSGWALRYRMGETVKTIELDVTREAIGKFKSGDHVRITGRLSEKEYVERGKVQVLVVRDIVADDAARH